MVSETSSRVSCGIINDWTIYFVAEEILCGIDVVV